jgi:hypothetical protein
MLIADERLLRQTHLQAGRMIEHPTWQLDGANIIRSFQLHSGCRPVAPLGAIDNHNPLAVPRMPGIIYFPNDVFVGLLSPGCTTIAGRTARWATGPPPSSPPRAVFPQAYQTLKPACACGKTARGNQSHLPNQHSHNPWYRKRGHSRTTSASGIAEGATEIQKDRLATA